MFDLAPNVEWREDAVKGRSRHDTKTARVKIQILLQLRRVGALSLATPDEIRSERTLAVFPSWPLDFLKQKRARDDAVPLW